MANFTIVLPETGLTLIGKVYNSSGVQQGSDVTMTESATNVYTGTYSESGLAAGTYEEFAVLFSDTGVVKGEGVLKVENGVEVNDRLLQDAIDETNANETKIDTVDTVVDAIKAVTDNLPNSGALTDIDTGVNNIEAKLPTGTISDLTAAQVNTEVDTALTDYDGPKKIDLIIRTATAQAGTSTTITLDASASAVNSFYNNTVVYIKSGTGAGQSRRISAYVGSTKVATVANAWQTNPDATSVFNILPRAQVNATLNSTQSAQLTAIEADTNELQTDWANGGRLDNILDARASQTSVDTVDSNVDAILVDTNELQTDWTDGGRLDNILDARASQTSVDTVDTVVDSNATILTLLNKYHDNLTKFFDSDGTTEIRQGLAYFMTVYDDDDTTPLKTIAFRDSGGNPVAMGNATRYVNI